MSCGLSKNGKWRKQTWWWDISVNDAVKEKRRLWKIRENGGSKEDYVLAKKVDKWWVFAAKKKAEKEKMKDIETETHIIYRIAKQMKQENKDIVGEKCIWDDSAVLALIKKKRKKHGNSSMKGYWMSNSPDEKRIRQLLIRYLEPLFLSLRRWW